MLGTDLHNFADINTVTAIAETIQGLINSPEVKTSNATDSMKDNAMIANPDKFKTTVLTETDHNTVGIRLEFSEETILSGNKIDLQGVKIDTKLSLDSLITKICRKASRQINALKRLGFYIPQDTSKILANSCMISSFNYCPLVLYFSIAKNLQKIEKVQERVVRFLHDNYVPDYSRLLKASGLFSMEIRRMRYLCLEIYKTLNNLNKSYMRDIFQSSSLHILCQKTLQHKIAISKSNNIRHHKYSVGRSENLESLTKLT